MNKHHYKVILGRDLQPTVIASELAKVHYKLSRTICAGEVLVFKQTPLTK